MSKITLIILSAFLISCTQQKQAVEKEDIKKTSDFKVQKTNTKIIVSEKERLISEYKPSKTKINDLINTKLFLSFDYDKRQVIGNAEITLKPHYYPTDSLTLDAQCFIIKDVLLNNGSSKQALNYEYKNSKIYINLDQKYTRNDTFKIQINYIAEPDKIKKTGSWGIQENRGLYFIDTDTENPQIWTQGETQSNSAWFPTIDSPNQKMTQDIYLTVKKEYKTLSNGNLISSLLNNDGTRTDYWKQTIPHAPYLAVIAVGKFNVFEEDAWKNVKVDVFVEDGDEEQAKKLFKNTAKMIGFFSQKLNYDFPWDKYSQIIVRDFVSGAMENTGAVVFGNNVLNFKNEDGRIKNEIVVVHELSHHWFGDLVTCESWANLPLNESFATYCEYIWLEHQYGRLIADRHIAKDYRLYEIEHLFKDESLIRFYNKHRDDMFDYHSYQKGGLILHMLRHTVGDDAFWDALSLYLKTNEYKTAEIHNLRLAFEDVTGEDLNWFFNQWFLSKGIPELNIEYSFDKNLKKANVKIEQNQNLNEIPLYKIPTYIDFYFKDKTIRKKIEINEQTENFVFKFSEKPLAINFDPENSILCEKKENYTNEEYTEILDKAPLFKDKTEAFKNLKSYSSKRLNEVFIKLCKNEYWRFRYEAISRLNCYNTDFCTSKMKNKVVHILENIAKNDKNIRVKNLAKNKLDKLTK